jgi:hypothetical protein
MTQHHRSSRPTTYTSLGNTCQAYFYWCSWPECEHASCSVVHVSTYWKHMQSYPQAVDAARAGHNVVVSMSMLTHFCIHIM